MKQTLKRSVSLFLALVMVLSVSAIVPFTVFAVGVDYNHNTSTSTDEYYNLISKTDWDNAPGITESEIVLNNDTGTYRQVIHIMKADLNNQFVKVIPSYTEMNTSVYQTSVMSEQAKWIDENMEGSVVGIMNCCLSWYSGYPADRVGEPLGFMMLNGEIMFDPGNCGYEYGKVGFPTCVVINKDYDENSNPRPGDIPKVEMISVNSAADLDGWEETVIPVSSGFIVENGVNKAKPAHGNDAHPRSVVGITADGQVIIMENDGRQEPFSAGMNMYECAEVMLAAGCVWAANCDGGGSSTFISRRPGEELKVNNSPSDGGERPSTSGICFITTALSDGKFERANISAEGEYFTPESKIQFSAVGADVAGGFATIPEDAQWTLSDSSFGNIDQNGLFVSNGKCGAVSAQIVYKDKVYGSCEIKIVIPDNIQFNQSVLTVPNGAQSTFSLSATYGIYEVVSKDSDFVVKLDNDNMGTLSGNVITATDDLSVTGGSITATLVYDSSVTKTMSVMFGKASDVLWDFEDGFGDGWYVENLQQRKNNKHAIEGLNAYNNILKSYSVTSKTGMVHDGNGAGAVYSDTTYGTLNWLGATCRWAGETLVIENAKSIGLWVYFPKDAVSTAVRFCFTAKKDGQDVSVDAYPINYGDSLYFEESGWRFCSVDVSEYDSITLKQNDPWDPKNPTLGGGARIELSCQLNGGSSGEYNWQTTPGVAGMNTFFLDNFIVDYSEACDDREAPIFGEVEYVEPISTVNQYLNNQRTNATITNYNNIGFAVNVEENTEFVNATGLNKNSIKAYIDGNEVEYSFNGKTISVSAVDLKNGVHTIKFTACDMAGNYASVIRKINVKATNNDANIWIEKQIDDTLVPTGSQYWIDVVAKNVENVEKVTLTLDLNNVNYWLLDHMTSLYGFTATYTTDVAGENIAYITITRTGTVEAVGENVIVSIPVQTWAFDEDLYPGYVPSTGGDNDLNKNGMYDPYECWKEYVGHNYDIIINPMAGLVEFTDGTNEMFSGDKIQVDTERQIGCWWSLSAALKQEYFLKYDKSSWHIHSAGTAQDKSATCTEDGYIGRVFCVGCSCVTMDEKGHECDSADGCGAVLDWGVTVSATGHTYEFIDGVLICSCGKKFNGIYVDGKTYFDGVVPNDGWYEDTYYFIDGVKVTGQKLIDGVICTFDENGVYQPTYSFTGFYHDGTGWTYYMGNFQKKGFVVIDGNTHYFDDNTGYAPIGSFTLAVDRVYKVEGDQGKVIGAWDTVIDNGVEYKRYYYSLRYYKNEWHEVEGEKYFFNNEGYALTGTHAVAAKGEYLGGYRFDDEGRLIEAITGPFVDKESGWMFFAENGKLACNELVKYGNDYYFARNNYLLITWGTYISEEQTNGLLPAGEYQFGADGKLQLLNGPVVDPYNSSYINFYKNGIRVYEEGLYEYEGDYYYVRANGLLLTWGMYITKTNGLLPAGEYKFGTDGKLQMLNGPVEDAYNSTYLNFYKDGVRVYEEGLYEYDGDYYYVRANGLLLTWGMNITKTNGLLPAGEYKFGTDGKLQMLNGPVEDAYNSAYLNFYKDGVRVYEEGLYEYDGNYYYVRANGLLLTWGMNITKTNGLLPAGEYKFGTDGKLQMLNGPVEDAYNSAYLNFYKNGIRVYEEGLYEYNGDYYYVRSNGLLLTWGMNITKTNGLLPAGEYKFASDGKLIMQNGPVADALNPQYINFYKDGIRVYKEGLYEYDGDYYYVRANGLLITWGTYVSEEKANGLLPAGDYEFGTDGKLIK